MELAYEAHREQVDKSGILSIYHPLHFAEQMDDENSVTVVLLRGVVEDAEMTFDEL